MYEDICKMIALKIADRTRGFVNVQILNDRINQRPYLVVTIKYGQWRYKHWFKETPIDEYFSHGGSCDKLARMALRDYDGWLKYNLIDKVFFKDPEKEGEKYA